MNGIYNISLVYWWTTGNVVPYGTVTYFFAIFNVKKGVKLPAYSYTMTIWHDDMFVSKM